MRRTPPSHRIDRDASLRRARAQAHLDRVRRGRHGRSGGSGRARLPGRARWVAVLAAGLGALFGEPLLEAALFGARPVEVIAVRGAERLSAAEVAGATGIAAGATLSDVDAAAVSQALERHDWIARAQALRLPRGAVLVDVVERRPVATVAIRDTLYAVDERGAPFAPLDAQPEPPLVRLVAGGDVEPREPSRELAVAVRLARHLPELGIAAPEEVTIASPGDPEGYALRLASMPARVLLGRADPDARLEDLAHLLAARPDAVAGVTSIDLRFANQVVLRSEPARAGPAHTAAERGAAPPRNRRPTG